MLYRLAVQVLLGATVLNFVRCDIYRLPNNVKPIRYTLTMEPHLESNLNDPVPYNGSIVIELQILENTRSIIFHKNMFDIDNTSIAITSTHGTELTPSATSEDKAKEIYTISLENELAKGENYNLTIENFYGYLRDGEGFFLVKYWTYPEFKIRGAAVTHFEPSGARTAFPCFDEPALKATFVINLIRREGYHSLSNEELEKTENLGDGRFKDTFKETPKMSTYIVAFVVSSILSTERIERHKIFATPGAMAADKKQNYSLNLAVKTLQSLEEYTEINFTLSKVDHFSVPKGSFKESAMENWGLIVYIDTYLFSLYDRPYGASHLYDLKRITLCIAHELTHQWFGNLVTPEWWDFIWLSESFAAYFQYYISSIIQPSWKLMDQYVIDVVHKAFRVEESNGGHPLNYHIFKRIWKISPFSHNVRESLIKFAFQGGSIMRMANHFLTKHIFKKGLQKYLQNRKFNTAVPADLYSAFQKAVDDAGVNSLLNNFTVADILGTWDSNEGFPLVTVTRNYTSGSITLVQEPKSVNWTTKENWKIPITYVFSSDADKDFSKTTADFWLSDKSATINKNFPTEGWILINKQQTGYYRVNYDLENWERLIQFMKTDGFKSIHLLNRAQLIDDSFNLAWNKKIPFDVPLRLCEYLIQEKDYIPWAAFYEAVSNYLDIPYNRDNKGTYPYEFFQSFSQMNGLNSTLDELGVFQEYIRYVTKGLRAYLDARSKREDSFLDNFNRHELYRNFPYFLKQY